MTIRDDRVQMRVDAAAKRRLEDAANEVGLSLSAFVLQAAQQQAAHVLAERALIQLAPGAAAVFSEALARPSEVNERLAAAMSRPTKFAWLD